MIAIDFYIAIAIFLSASTALVIGRWIFYNCSGDGSLIIETKNFYECPICVYTFFSYEDTDLKICPRCESYIEMSVPPGKNHEKNP